MVGLPRTIREALGSVWPELRKKLTLLPTALDRTSR